MTHAALGSAEPCRRQLNEIAHSGGFGLRDLAAEGGDAIVAPPLVVQMRIRALVRLFDEALREHLADRPVQHTRAECELPVGPARDLAFQGIAMTFPVAQAQQDVEHRGGSGRRSSGFGFVSAY